MTRKIPVFIQSFEVDNLKELNTRCTLIQLLDAKDIALDGQLIEKLIVVSGDSRTYRSADSSRLSRGCRVCGWWSLERMIVSVRSSDQNGDGKADDITGDGLVNDADKVLTDPTSLIDDAICCRLLCIHTPSVTEVSSCGLAAAELFFNSFRC